MRCILKIGIYLIAIIHSTIQLPAQILQKDEIMEILRKNSQNNKMNYNLKEEVTHDSCLYSAIGNIIKDCEDNKIDTLGMLKITYPQFSSTNKCISCKHNSDFFFFFKKNGAYTIQYSKCNCSDTYKIEQVNLSPIYILEKNFDKIKDEFIYPVVFSAERQNEKIIYQGEILFHSNIYQIYFQTNNDFKWITFSQNEIMNKENLFYKENISTYLYQFISGFKDAIKKE